MKQLDIFTNTTDAYKIANWEHFRQMRADGKYPKKIDHIAIGRLIYAGKIEFCGLKWPMNGGKNA
jgi:hypothetical protein